MVNSGTLRIQPGPDTKPSGHGEKIQPLIVLGLDSNLSFQPSLFSKTSHFPRLLGGFLERRIPGKNGEVTSRSVG